MLEHIMIDWRDVLDIAIVAFAIYKIIDFIRKTRAQQLLKGLLILVAIAVIGSSINNARRWLFGFQPSEIAMLTFIICFSYWVALDP